MIRIDITYVHGFHVGEQFPAAPATLFQAIVAANGHRLDSVTDMLEALECAKCVRIVNRGGETTPVSIMQYVPRLPKVSEIRKTFETETENRTKLAKPQKYFPVTGAGPHLSYYFDLDLSGLTPERLNKVLRLNVLGRGESVVCSQVHIVDSLPISESGTVFEPADQGRTLRVPYEGFLENLRLLHNAGQSSFGAPPVSQRFARRDSVAPYVALCFDLVDETGETFSYPQKNLIEISGMLRCAVMRAVEGKCDPEYVAGHTPNHPAYIPLPSIGHRYVDRDIRRVLIVERAETPILQKHKTALTTLNFVDHSGHFVCRAIRQTTEDGVFKRYLSPSKEWFSVTPVIRLFDNGKQKKREKIFKKMIADSGLPVPIRVQEFPVREEFKVNARHGHDKYPCAMFALEFAQEVSGVVSLGMGRFTGLGIFANRDDFSAETRFAKNQQEIKQEQTVSAAA